MSKIIKLTIFLSLMLFIYSTCCFAQVDISGISREVIADDGYSLVTYELYEGEKYKPVTNPKAIFFYIQGSEHSSVTSRIDMLASTVILGGRAILMEKRGCYHDHIDTNTCYRYAAKQTRVKDHLTVIEEYLKDVPKVIPVILIGGSEGGDVASQVAEKSNRVTHLILIGTGGGWSQKTELRFLVNLHPDYLGCKNITALDSIFDSIEHSSNDSLLWAGQPYKRWNSYLNDSNLIYLKNIDMPILLLHGERDGNVPVQSARELQNAFKLSGKSNLTYIEYKNLDHRLNDVNDNESRYPFIEVDIIKWLKQEKVLQSKEADKFIQRIKEAHEDIF